MAVGDKKPVVMEADRAVANGVATLDGTGKLTEDQRPDYEMSKVTGLEAALAEKAVKTEMESRLGTLDTFKSTTEGTIETLNSDMEQAKSDIETAQGDIESAQSDISGLQTSKADQTALTEGLAAKEDKTTVAALTTRVNNFEFIPDGAGPHNAVYRGAFLGASVTPEQSAVIKDGSFKGLFIGDYWQVDTKVYRIAAFDYYLRSGYQDLAPDYGELKTHHAVIVPDNPLDYQKMNETDSTNGAYLNSYMYTTGLNLAKSIIGTDFSGHLVDHWEFLANAATAGYEAGRVWTLGNINLMNENMVYGTNILAARAPGAPFIWSHTNGRSQLPLFTYRPDLISNRQNVWLQDVCTSVYFANADYGGLACCYPATSVYGVRPAFTIS